MIDDFLAGAAAGDDDGAGAAPPGFPFPRRLRAALALLGCPVVVNRVALAGTRMWVAEVRVAASGTVDLACADDRGDLTGGIDLAEVDAATGPVRAFRGPR